VRKRFSSNQWCCRFLG